MKKFKEKLYNLFLEPDGKVKLTPIYVVFGVDLLFAFADIIYYFITGHFF